MTTLTKRPVRFGRGRPTDLQRGLELLHLYRTGGGIELSDHPLAQQPHVQEAAHSRFARNPFGTGIVLQQLVRETLTECAEVLEASKSTERLAAFVRATAAGLGPGAAAAAAGHGREWGSRRLIKQTADLLMRGLSVKLT